MWIFLLTFVVLFDIIHISQSGGTAMNVGTVNPNEVYPCTLGLAAVIFREPSDKRPHCQDLEYVLNGGGDGWFRVKDKHRNSFGYGLMIDTIKITNKGIVYGDGTLYKAQMDYRRCDNNEPDKSPAWLFVHKNTTVDEIVAYINSTDWQP